MLKLAVLFSFAVFSLSVPARWKDPGEIAATLSEEEFEDYLDAWLANTVYKRANTNTSIASNNEGCAINVNGGLGKPQPVYMQNNNYLSPSGNSGQILLNPGEEIYIACTGNRRTIQHPNSRASVATGLASCEQNSHISAEWLEDDGEFGELTCTNHAVFNAEYTTETCYNDNRVIRVGFIVDEVFYPLYYTCFDENRLEVLYAWYDQKPPNAVHQANVDRPSWFAGSFFPKLTINTLYTKTRQKSTIASVVGTELARKYVSNSQYLARGHLAAKTDFIFATGQRSTFYFINCAPQWQMFNAGNWNWLEQALRIRIGVAGYEAIIYTGTFGVSQLRNEQDELVDIYLHRDANNNPQVPVPLYYYKVAYDSSRRLGTAFVGINNPYYDEDEVRELTFCEDRCRNNSDFSWLNWQPDRIDYGYSFCCTIEEFRKFIPHIPDFEAVGLLV